MFNDKDEYNNVYKNGIASHKPRFWLRNIKQRIYNHKMARQRAKRGWCDADTWDIEGWFLRVMPEMLEYFIDHNEGCPDDIEYHEWVRILSKMRNHLYYALDDHNPENIFQEQYHAIFNKCRSVTNFDNDTVSVNIDKDKALEHNYEEVRQAMIHEEQRRHREMNRNLKEGMKLLARYLRHMWW